LTSAWTRGLRAKNYFWCTKKNFALKRCTIGIRFKNIGRPKKPDNEKASKPGVALDEECRTILSKIMEYETSLRNDLAKSQAIRKCMKIAWDLHYKPLFEKYESTQNMDVMAVINEKSPQKSASKTSNTTAPVGAKKVTLSESLGSGSLPAAMKTSRRGG
jgi:hypothetical protein